MSIFLKVPLSFVLHHSLQALGNKVTGQGFYNPTLIHVAFEPDIEDIRTKWKEHCDGEKLGAQRRRERKRVRNSHGG